MIAKMVVERVATTLKFQIPKIHLHTLRNHFHQNQITKRFPQFSFYKLPSNLHLPVRHRSLRPQPPLLRPQLLNMSYQASPAPPSDSSTPIKTVRVVIKGRVQGVFYRNWTVENATDLGLNGWVRNRRDGSVEALFSGAADKVGEMQERCRRGPPSAMVTGLDVNPSNEDPGLGFERRPTV